MRLHEWECVHVCVWECVWECVHVCIWNVCVHMGVCACVHMGVCDACIWECLYVCTWECVCVHMGVCACVHMGVCVCVVVCSCDWWSNYNSLCHPTFLGVPLCLQCWHNNLIEWSNPEHKYTQHLIKIRRHAPWLCLIIKLSKCGPFMWQIIIDFWQ